MPFMNFLSRRTWLHPASSRLDLMNAVWNGVRSTALFRCSVLSMRKHGTMSTSMPSKTPLV